MAKKTLEQIAKENEELKAQLAAANATIEASKAKKIIPVKLPAEVAKEFELVNWVGSHRQSFGKFGIIDLTKLTPASTQALVNRGFAKIQKISKLINKT